MNYDATTAANQTLDATCTRAFHVYLLQLQLENKGGRF